MELTQIQINGISVMEGVPDAAFLQHANDVSRIVEACYAEDAQAVLLYAANLTPGFFDLRSGDAGEILQKLRTYQIRLAVVCPAGSVTLSDRFKELLVDERRGSDFGVFEARDEAYRWLERT